MEEQNINQDIQEEIVPYVSLHNHTYFSILDSLIKPEQLFKRCKELGQTAVAITDHGSLGAMWDALKASKSTGVKLIPGCEFYFVDDVSDTSARIRHVILLSKNEIGYRNLLKLSKAGFDNHVIVAKKVIPRIDWNLLEEHKEGLICLTACGGGIIAQFINNKNIEEAEKQATRLKEMFGDDLAIELQANAVRRNSTLYGDQVDQTFTNRHLKKIAEKLQIKMVATTNAHYVNPEDYDAHDTWLAIGAGQPKKSNNRLRYSVNDFYIKSGKQVRDFFTRNYGIDFANELVANSLYFADKCEFPGWIDPKYSNPSGKELPEFPVKDQPDYEEFLEWKKKDEQVKDRPEDEAYLKFKCEQAFKNKVPVGMEEEYRKRLEEEFDVLCYCGVASYMLIVYDFVNWAKNNGVSVGPGRGSVSGSIVAYLLNIHIADSIKYDLVFERFHNKLKKDYSDIDLDFCTSKRYLVEQYIIEKYGRDKVAHISNFNTLTPKVFARAIARAFEYGGDRKTAVQIGTAIADSIPGDVKNMASLSEKAPLFGEYAKKYNELNDFANILNKNPVALSTHAAGIVISKRSLLGLVPLRKDKDNQLALEYEKERAEQNGLVKMDILGLSTLDIIDQTYELIKKSGKQLPNFDYEICDEKTYNLISKGNTFCVFQLGTSAGTIDLCRKFRPKNIEDLAIITTLARPAAQDLRKDFFDTKNGLKPIEYMHPLLERAFKKTLGFPLYDESLLILAQDVAGWDLSEADRLRKLTKEKGKNPEKAKKWKQEFIDNAFERKDVDNKTAEEIWVKIVEPFGKYSFNKSHAVTYSMISYHTAYLKAHFPLEFLVANLMSEVNSNAKVAKDNIAKIKEEIRNFNIKILPPDINKSQNSYTILDEKTLITGFDALKNMGKDAIPEIIAKRPFTSFEDFLTRVDGKKVRVPAIQALAASGCLDSFGMPRKLMYFYCSDFKKKLQIWLKKDPNKRGEFNYPWPKEDEWSIAEMHAFERYYIGEGITGNKFDAYNGFFTRRAPNFTQFAKIHPPPREDMDAMARRKYQKEVNCVQAEIKSMFEFKVKKEDSKLFGQVMAKITLEDPYGNQMAMTCFPDAWVYFQRRFDELSKKKYKLEPGIGIQITGNLSWYEGDISITFLELEACCPPPQLPSNWKEKKKVAMKIGRAKKGDIEIDEDIDIKKSSDDLDRSDLLEEIEDELAELGLSDFDEDE